MESLLELINERRGIRKFMPQTFSIQENRD